MLANLSKKNATTSFRGSGGPLDRRHFQSRETLAPFTSGHGDDAEYYYVHPGTSEARRLEQRGLTLPAVSDFAGAPLPNARPPKLPSICELLDKAPALNSSRGLSNNITNTLPTPPQTQASVPLAESSKVPSKPASPAIEKNIPAKKREETKSAVGGGRKKLTAQDLILIARAVIEKMPFLEGHGNRTAAWQNINNELQANGLSCQITADRLRQKAEALNRESSDDKVRAIANTLKNTTDEIAISALLDRMESQWDEAKDASDSKKAQIKKKHEEDRLGGEAIRRASMSGLKRKRAHRDREDSDDDTQPDSTAGVTPSGSQSTLDNDDDDSKPQSKRRRSMDRRQSRAEGAISKLAALVEEDMTSRNQQHEEMMAALDQRGRRTEKLLGGFLAIEKDRWGREKLEKDRRAREVEKEYWGRELERQGCSRERSVEI
ncbi:hypothetical protein NLJ89_g5190 [Agrocybe chaxingu]|uniref:Uncharacterized protein n=1 Tax=Agrocybe chaxingu TaxID=84603 RepID=A0A9W8MTU8_9AGAR|nr:hypothetical protein NLJ89_g5190 [Agrocybe chaxingu]